MSQSIRISIANQKGGEGKTTTSLNLSHALALRGHKTLLIDMDPQANSSGIYISPEEVKSSIVDIFLNKTPVKDVILATKYDNLFLLPATIHLAEVEFTSLSVEAPYILRDSIASIDDEFDFIILDCPPSLSILTVNAMVASNYVIVPLQAEKFSVDGIKGLQNTVESIKRRINPDLQILGALVTQLKNNTVLTKTVYPIIQNYFPVFKTSISTGVVVGESHLMRKTILDYNKSVKQSQEYLSFADEIKNVLKK